MDGIQNSNRVNSTTNSSQGQPLVKRYKRMVKKKKAKVVAGY